jgi:hypothetical protein
MPDVDADRIPVSHVRDSQPEELQTAPRDDLDDGRTISSIVSEHGLPPAQLDPTDLAARCRATGRDQHAAVLRAVQRAGRG